MMRTSSFRIYPSQTSTTFSPEHPPSTPRHRCWTADRHDASRPSECKTVGPGGWEGASRPQPHGCSAGALEPVSDYITILSDYLIHNATGPRTRGPSIRRGRARRGPMVARCWWQGGGARIRLSERSSAHVPLRSRNGGSCVGRRLRVLLIANSQPTVAPR